MRDLGQLGESTFAMWCAQVGLIANSSAIDKTGWDYYVEFPISKNISANELHKSSFECKVQIKATDKQHRKLSITISNLRRLATAQIPSFYIFLEFDRKNEVQSAFVVHVDNELIYKILRRVHEIEQSDTDKNLHKKTMTLHYSEKNKLNKLDGESLQAILSKHIGHDYSEYITNKSQFLKKCGFENGYGKVTFSIEGEHGVQRMIDLSLGLMEEVNVENLISIDQRFGILAKKPSLVLPNAKLSIANKNVKRGNIRFKEDNLSNGLAFDISFYNALFNFNDFRKLSKFRIVGDFFDMTCEPYANKVHYNFILDENKRFEIRKLKDAITLINLISIEGQKVLIELKIENLEMLEFNLTSKFVKRELSIFDELLEKVLQICLHIKCYEEISISLKELYYCKQEIEQFHTLITKSNKCDFRVEFEVNHKHKFEFDSAASISVIVCRLGSYAIGAIITVFGESEEISINKFRINGVDLLIEKTFLYTLGNKNLNDDILKSIKNISSKYVDKYDIFYNWSKV